LIYILVIFYHSDRKSSNTKKTHLCHLDKIVFNTSSDPKTAIVISNTSIKNQVAISITHVHTHDSPVVKTIYHAINITSTEAKIFAIRCRLNQAIQLTKIEHIIIITDAIYTAKKIFNLLIYSYQIQSVAISKIIATPLISRTALVKKIGCFIVLSTKRQKFDLSLVFPCKSSWNFS